MAAESTMRLLRDLADSGDIEAALALHKYALRQDDEVLRSYLGALATRKVAALERDLERWRRCLPYSAVVLEQYDGKIRAIKEIRALTGLPLREAKITSESVPALLIRRCPGNMVQQITNAFGAVGARISTDHRPGLFQDYALESIPEPQAGESHET